LGLSTKVHTWFLSKLFNSSCIAITQSLSSRAFSTFAGSIEETKRSIDKNLLNESVSILPPEDFLICCQQDGLFE
jgi:hypothetical protein